MKFKFLLLPFCLCLLFGCKNVKDPEFRRIDKFRVKKIGLQEATVSFNITYNNPNSFEVKVRDGFIDVYADSVYLGKFFQDNQVEVEKLVEFSIPVTGNIPLQTFLHFNFQDLGERQIHLLANGSIKIGKAGFFITKPIHYEGDHKLYEIAGFK